MSTQQTEALQCAADLEYSISHHGRQDAFTLNAYSAMKMVRTQHARITELESQLAQRFDAADVATAAAQGFRDGATAPAQPVAEPAKADSVLEDALSDAVRVPLDSLHADAAYLIGRLREGSMPYARVIEIIRERIDAAKAAIRARASHGQAPAPTHEQIAAYLESTGAYVTNDATREAAIAEAIDTDRAKRGQAPDLHPKTSDLVQRFAAALAEKLSAAEKKYGYSDGWASPNWMDECRQHLSAHIAKGDPRDVAAYCAFLWHHGATTASPQAEQQAPTGSEIYVCARKCYNCGHAGINDDHADNAACKSCDWSGPSPEKDHCPDCEKDGTMTAACPMCSCAYIMVADTQVAAPAALNAPQATNTKTHELLSTTVGLLMGYREGAARQPYKPGSAIAKVVYEVVDHLKDWTYPEPTPPAAPADSVQEDAARLDWLDRQCEAYGFQDIHEGNRWEISGPYANVRQAIDYERAVRKQGEKQ